jgi:hypothetical protein
MFLNGRVIVAPLVIVGWTQETTPFQPIKDTTPPASTYQLMA